MNGDRFDGQDVIAMNNSETAHNQTVIRMVESYWNNLRGSSQVPLRADVDPRGIEGALENAFLMEKLASTLGKVRVAGSHMSDVMGMHFAGMPISSLILPEDRDRFGQALARVWSDPAILRLSLRAPGSVTRPDMQASMVILPLRSDMGDLSRAMGVFTTEGRIGRTPRRFEIETMEIEPVVTPDVLRPVLEAKAEVPGMAEVQAPFQTKSQRSYLRLVVSND